MCVCIACPSISLCSAAPVGVCSSHHGCILTASYWTGLPAYDLTDATNIINIYLLELRQSLLCLNGIEYRVL